MMVACGFWWLKDVDVIVERIVEITIGRTLHFDGLDSFEGLGVEHDHRVAAGESVMRFRRRRCAMHTVGVIHLADFFQRVEVVHHNAAVRLAAAAHIQLPVGGVRGDVIEAAIAAHFGRLQHLVRAIGWSILRECDQTDTIAIPAANARQNRGSRDLNFVMISSPYLPNYQYMEGIRQNRRTPFFAILGSRRRSRFGGQQKYLVSLSRPRPWCAQ